MTLTIADLRSLVGCSQKSTYFGCIVYLITPTRLSLEQENYLPPIHSAFIVPCYAWPDVCKCQRTQQE